MAEWSASSSHDPLKRLVAEWNAAKAACDVRREKKGRPGDTPRERKAIMKPAWDRQVKIANELALPLWKWAKANKLAGYNALFGLFMAAPQVQGYPAAYRPQSELARHPLDA
jgi:hypothetical protein